MTHLRKTSGATLATLGTASLLAACGGSAHATHTTRTAAGAGGAHGAAVKATPASDHRTLQLTLASGGPGEHLTGAGGRALYLWEGDRHNRSNCTGGCVQIWPPLLSRSKPAAGRGVRAAEIGLITRRGGQRQVTFNGHPLYYYLGDSGRGSTAGEGSDQFGARWWIVSPAGAAVTGRHTSGHASSGSGGSSGSSGSSGSGGGGW